MKKAVVLDDKIINAVEVGDDPYLPPEGKLIDWPDEAAIGDILVGGKWILPPEPPPLIPPAEPPSPDKDAVRQLVAQGSLSATESVKLNQLIAKKLWEI